MTEKTLLSFHGDASIKEKYLSRVRAHAAADEIIKGKYWENGKGCAVGCTIHGSKHDNYEPELGITWRLALLEDSLFENLPNGQAKEFPVKFLELMPVGVDTNLIFKKFVIWNLDDEKEGLTKFIKDNDARSLLKEIADTYRESFKHAIPKATWERLARKAASAYASAYAYAYADAYAYAYPYADAYAYAYAYADAYADAYRKNNFESRILQMRDKLFELMIASNVTD